MERYTIAQIKQRNTAAGYFFFERDTMRFFGNRMSDFRVVHINCLHTEPEVYIRAHNHNAPVGCDPINVYRFNPDTGDVCHVNLSGSGLEFMRKQKIGAIDYRFIAQLTYDQA